MGMPIGAGGISNSSTRPSGVSNSWMSRKVMLGSVPSAICILSLSSSPGAWRYSEPRIRRVLSSMPKTSQPLSQARRFASLASAERYLPRSEVEKPLPPRLNSTTSLSQRSIRECSNCFSACSCMLMGLDHLDVGIGRLLGEDLLDVDLDAVAGEAGIAEHYAQRLVLGELFDECLVDIEVEAGGQGHMLLGSVDEEDGFSIKLLARDGK